MSETDIRERLKDLAADAPEGFTAPSSLLRRTRRRVALTLASLAMVALAIVFGGIAGGRWLAASGRQPAVPPPDIQCTDVRQATQGRACTSNTKALDALCADVRQATQETAYNRQLWLAMERDSLSPGDDGYRASEDAARRYVRWGATGLSLSGAQRSEFLGEARQFLEGWCGDS